jgi:hypothetical protein
MVKELNKNRATLTSAVAQPCRVADIVPSAVLILAKRYLGSAEKP